MSLPKLVKGDFIEDYWLGIGDTTKLSVDYRPLFRDEEFYREHPGTLEIQCLRDPDYIMYTTWLLLGIKLQPFQAVIFDALYHHAFSLMVCSRGAGKTWILGLYALMKALFTPNYKIILAGAAFRQSQFIFNYIEEFWNNSPVLRSMCDKASGPVHRVDRWDFRINSSLITAIPIGPTGDKVRGLRANCVLCDEFSAHNPQIVEEVIFGFAATASSPSEQVIERAKREALVELGIALNSDEELFLPATNNQSIISGTADYHFNHFFEYWQRYKKIINSRGDKEIMEEIFHGKVPESISWKDFCVIRLPYSLLPKNFMDDKTIARAKASMSPMLYKKEYEATFVEDSDGFFKRSTIERAVASEKNINTMNWPIWCPDPFYPALDGQSDLSYVFGVDPASEQDNFAIVVLENRPEHARIVYTWTTNKADFRNRRQGGQTNINDYYKFCARKIRDLMRGFPCIGIGLDKQGGGIAVAEALSDTAGLKENEVPIWETIDYERPKITDTNPGLHILEFAQFANANWLTESNFALLQDLESRTILFPGFDAVSIELSIAYDKIRGASQRDSTRLDSLEDCIMEIEALKDEITNVIYSRTSAGVNSRAKFSVPCRIEGGSKIIARKDRYSALLIANAFAHKLRSRLKLAPTNDYYMNKPRATKKAPQLYSGPEWLGDYFK